MRHSRVIFILTATMFSGTLAMGETFRYFGAHLSDQSPWINKISVYNNGNRPATFQITVWETRGELAFGEEYIVPGNSSVILVMSNYSAYIPGRSEVVLAPVNGTFIVETDSPKLRPKVSYQFGDSPSLCELFLQDTVAFEYVLPNTVQDQFVWTGIVVMNHHDEQIKVRLKAFGCGELQGETEVDIDPHTKYVQLSDGIWPGISHREFDQVNIVGMKRAFPPPMSIVGNQAQDRHVFFLGAVTATSDLAVIAFSVTPPDGNNEIFVMEADGSGLRQLTDNPGRDCGPAWSPNGEKIAFYVHHDDVNTWSEYVMDADGSNIQRLTDRQNVWDSAPAWTPDGKILFGRQYPQENHRSEIWMINPDGSDLHRIGDIEGGAPNCSPDGSQIVFCSFADGDGEIWVVNIDGSNPIRLTENQAEDWWPSWSPDGHTLAFQSDRDGNHEIYLMNIDGNHPNRITNNSSEDGSPKWSADGTELVFDSFRDGHYEIYKMNIDGSNQVRLTQTDVHAIQPSWKPRMLKSGGI